MRTESDGRPITQVSDMGRVRLVHTRPCSVRHQPDRARPLRAQRPRGRSRRGVACGIFLATCQGLLQTRLATLTLTLTLTNPNLNP